MSFASVTAVAAVGVAVCTTAPAAAADASLRFRATTSLTATSDGGIGSATAQFTSVVRPDGREQVAIDVRASALDVTRDAQGAFPVLRVVIAPAEASPLEIGTLSLTARGAGRLRLRNVESVLAGRALRDLEGASVQVRRGDVVLLRGDLGRLALDGAASAERVLRVWGDFVAVDRPRRSPGSFLLTSVTLRDGSHRDRVTVTSPKIETDTNPDYRAYVVDRTGGRVVGLGSLRRELRLGASLDVRQADGGLPGIGTIEEFGGGRVEVRLGSTVLLRGYAPEFPTIQGGGSAQRSAAARGAEELAASSGPARALLTARVSTTESRHVESFVLRVVALSPSAGPYRVTARDVTGTLTELGTLTTSGAAGTGRLAVSSARGERIAGGVAWLSRQTVEVRAADGSIALSGEFPRLK